MTKKESSLTDEKIVLTPTIKSNHRGIKSVFLDSGAFSLYNKQVPDRTIVRNHKFFKSKEFWKYVDNYGAFLHKYGAKFDHYANCDAIYDPEMSYKVLKHLEDKFGVNPVPVIHSMTNHKWIEKYISEGYDLIGLGGAGSAPRSEYLTWTDTAFDIVCSTKDRLPKVRIHGFAITGYSLLVRYPWWSVDSASWAKWSSYGTIYVPKFLGGKFIYPKFKVNKRNPDIANYNTGKDWSRKKPYPIFVSNESPRIKDFGRHIDTVSKTHNLSEPEMRKRLLRWLAEIDVPLGSKTEWGVVSKRTARLIANLRFFYRVIESLEDWPWAFHIHKESNLGLNFGH